ncbi:PH domain-containing protein [Thermocatellispora tengchongensis]|uniref:PH domain-containing protein n=1 Tax=Thermocatellispora tengchongensis TaxID=1073253 RepID=UPI003633D8D4
MTASPTPPGPPGPVPGGAPPPGQGPAPSYAPAARLSPRMLLIDPVRMLPSLFLPLVGVLFVGGFSPPSFGWAAIGVVGSVAYSVIRWATFTYRIVDDRLELTRALVSRSVRTIPLERVRGVDIATPPLHRLLGLAVLRIDTGAHGAGKQEGELDGVTVAEAERLKTVLLRTARARRAATPGAGPEIGPDGPLAAVDAPAAGAGTCVPGEAIGASEAIEAGASAHAAAHREPEVVYARVPRKWLRYGPLSGAYLLTPFALAAGAVGLAFQWGEQLGFGGDAAVSAGRWLWDHPYLLLVAAALLVVAMPLAGVVMYAIFNWDFTLRSRDGYLVAERGLITRRSVSLERRRVRGFEIVEGLAERWAGVARVWAIVTGLGDSQTRGQLLPVVPRAEAGRVTGAAIGVLAAPCAPTRPPRAVAACSAPSPPGRPSPRPALSSRSPPARARGGCPPVSRSYWPCSACPSAWTATAPWATRTTARTCRCDPAHCAEPRRWSNAARSSGGP